MSISIIKKIKYTVLIVPQYYDLKLKKAIKNILIFSEN